MYSYLAISLSVLATLLTGTAWADDSVPTTTDEAREAAGRANYRVAFVEPRPAVPANQAWLTTTDGIRADFARAHDQHTVSPWRTPPIAEPILIPTTTDEARAMAGQRNYQTTPGATTPVRASAIARPRVTVCPYEPAELCHPPDWRD